MESQPASAQEKTSVIGWLVYLLVSLAIIFGVLGAIISIIALVRYKSFEGVQKFTIPEGTVIGASNVSPTGAYIYNPEITEYLYYKIPISQLPENILSKNILSVRIRYNINTVNEVDVYSGNPTQDVNGLPRSFFYYNTFDSLYIGFPLRNGNQNALLSYNQSNNTYKLLGEINLFFY